MMVTLGKLSVFKQTSFYFDAYFVSYIFWLKNGTFDSQYFKSKHKVIKSCQKMSC